jgi:hypothetical protein
MDAKDTKATTQERLLIQETNPNCFVLVVFFALIVMAEGP